MIRLHYSNRSERLALALAEELAQRADPLEPVTIVVPNRPMERWVEMRLAALLGVAANLRFARLERFASEQLAREGAPRVLSAAELEGRVLATLLDPRALEAEALEPVRAYLRAAGDDADSVERRAVQLAARLAHLLQEYGYSRPRMLDAWARGELALGETALAATETWQRAIWLEARARSRGNAETEALTLAEALTRAPSDARPLAPSRTTAATPTAVHVFGVSYVARVFQQALAALSARTELHVYALNPCEEFWEDALSDAEARRRLRRARATDDDDPYALLSGVESTLLRAWGRPGREHVAMLDELTGFDAHARFEEPGDATRLARIQSSILHRAPLAQASEAQPDPRDASDGSVRLLACPSIRREIETVAAEIWAAIDASRASDRPLRFHEIAVLVNGPDRDRYLPHLEAVFAESHDLPWNAADLALAARSRVADCALRLIDLPSTSFTRAEVLEVIAHPLVVARWPDADPARVVALCDRLGVFHGIDARDHRGTYLESSGLVHWDQAVRRLALGALMEGEKSGALDPFTGVPGMALHPEEIAASDEVAIGLGLLVRSLAADARFARTAKMLPSAWARFFESMLRSYLVLPEGSEESELRRCLSALATLAERDAGVEVGYRIAAELACGELEALPAARGVPLGDGVVVASLLPMRAIPFRAIFVLGLGEGRFPARELDTGLDLRAAVRAPGDVAIDERDRYTFLETLLCAREQLVLSWVARDEQTGEPRPPSSVVATLEEALGAPLPRSTPPLRRHEIFTSAPAELTPVVAHALPAAEGEARARAAGAQHRRALADARFPEAALASLADDDPRRALLAMPPIPRRARIEPGAEVDAGIASTGSTGSTSAAVADARASDAARGRVSIAAIRRFLECPIQGHARLAIGEDVRDGHAAAAEDEPFDVDRGEREPLLLDVFLAALGQDDRALERAYDAHVARRAAHGAWPIGALAAMRRDDDRADLDAWRRAFARWDGTTELTRWRFGASVARREHALLERPHDPVAIRVAGAAPGEPGALDVIGATATLLPGGDAVRPTTARGLEGDGERAKVERLRHALRAFVDHAVLSAAGLAGSGVRRAWVLDRSSEGPLAIQLAPMRREAAERWLAGVLEDLRDGPHGLFLPCEAVLRCESLFVRGGDDPKDELARSIEVVRTKSTWEGGSSRFGPVRDAALHPAPEPARALALASRRFRAFFDHVRGMRRTP